MLKSKKTSLIKSVLFRILLIFLCRIDKSAEMFVGPGFCSVSNAISSKVNIMKVIWLLCKLSLIV